MNFIIHSAIEPLLSFYKDVFSIRITYKGWYDIEQKKPNQIKYIAKRIKIK